MALIKACRGFTPQIGPDCFLAENATVVGDVIMGEQCSVWFSAVVRGDVNSIRMGNKVNIQDGAVLHCTYEKTKLNIGNNVSIGHNALVHGCTIEDNVLIGMGSIVMDNCYIEANSRVASWSIYAGIPAKKIKTLTPELFAGEVQRIANNYVLYSSWFKENP
jgi:carbonic anhydrase/acetyltransferase-like protein (isoleucine patch superfamily)